MSADLLGIICEECGSSNSRVLQKRKGRGYVRRRHACQQAACLAKHVRWTTYEFFSPRRGVITLPRDTRAIRSTRAFESHL